MKNKGQLGTLQTIILTLVVIGVLLGIGFLVLESFQDQLDDTTTTIVQNESITLSGAGSYLSKNYTTAGINCWNTVTILQVYNLTTPQITVVNGNWSISEFGKFTNTTGLAGFNKVWNVTYSYKSGGDACGGVEDTINATKEIPGWLSIIVILAIVGILLAIVFTVLPKAGGSSSGTVAEI